MRIKPRIHANKKELLALGVFGGVSRMGERIARLLERGREFSPRASKGRLAGCAVGLVACALATSISPRMLAFAQTRPSFEVASVKAIAPGTHAEPKMEISGSNFTAERYTMKGLMEWAYGMEGWRISGPGWIGTQEFDIRAKAAGPAWKEQFQQMVQTLLEDRFKLTLLREQKTVSAYALTLGKTGPAMHEVQEEPRDGGRLGWDDGVFFYQMVNRVSKLAEMLPDFLDGRPVVDRTGLSGVYEIALRVHMDPDQFSRMPQPGAVWTGFGYAPGVFDAVEQLGLKLEAKRESIEMLVIDHAEKPDEN